MARQLSLQYMHVDDGNTFAWGPTYRLLRTRLVSCYLTA
jgi:hypothetical protein